MRRFCLIWLLAIPALSAAACPPLLDQRFRPLAGTEPVHLCEAYAGKVLLVVNTASKCGFTPQYEGLEALHQRLAERGFAVLGFPSNDFLGQEPGTEEEIRQFCTLTYGVRFPMFEKVSVKGEGAVAFFRKLAADPNGTEPAWNFHKFLIARDGRLVAHYGSRTKPDDPAMLARIDELLAEPSP